MKARILGVAVVAVCALAAVAMADKPMTEAMGPPNAAFEKMKLLVGTWEGKGTNGQPVKVTYSLVSDGSALMEMLGHGKEPSMVTMYHPDGSGTLMMTHYCGAHNQPRMRAAVPSEEIKALAFEFVDCTNLSAPEAGHMHHLVLTFEDRNHFSQEWTWKEKDKEGKEVFQLARKKS